MLFSTILYLLLCILMKKFSILLVCALCVLVIYGCGWSNSCSNSWNYNDYWKEEWKRVYCYGNWQLKAKWSFKNGDKNGKWIYYYENWQLRAKWSYKDEEFDWKWVYYYENWKIQSKLNYKNGEKNGKQTIYNENWEVSSEETYKDGVIKE